MNSARSSEGAVVALSVVTLPRGLRSYFRLTEGISNRCSL